MLAFSYPAKFTAGSDGRTLVEFIDQDNQMFYSTKIKPI